jgi:hypothetical protein
LTSNKDVSVQFMFKNDENFGPSPNDFKPGRRAPYLLIFQLVLGTLLVLSTLALIAYSPPSSSGVMNSAATGPKSYTLTEAHETTPSSQVEEASPEIPSGNPAEVQGPQGIKKDIVDLQLFRRSNMIHIVMPQQGLRGVATLVNLNPSVNAWYLLRVQWEGDQPEEAYHLENANPETQRLLLDANNPQGLIITDGENRDSCQLWGTGANESLRNARKSGVAYAPLCGGKIFLRNPTQGHRTKIEKVTDFLRDGVPGGERIVVFVRDTFFKDRYRKIGAATESKSGPGEPWSQRTEDGPTPAVLDAKQGSRVLKPEHLAIGLEEPCADGMPLGTWCAVKDNPGVFFSLISPNAIAPEILASYTNIVSGLDSVEAEQIVYLVAFDLERFEVRFALGTEHPRVEWSDHMLDALKDKTLPGPDGIGSIAPLVSTGLISPGDAFRTVATFTGGFKRSHGAFKYGTLATKNSGSHYGFIENGVLFSKLQPGLSTLYTLAEGWMDMKCWEETDNRLLPWIRYARQNGVPIINDFDGGRQMSVPGRLVSRWGDGNWSGSADKKLRTLRAGAALQETPGKRFLLYAVFWSATPSAMARVFQAYRCKHAMLLDMNALEHTYMAVYKREGTNLYIQHLIQGMSEVDRSKKGSYIPRFLGYSDNRDFFYLVRKENL